MSKADIPFTIRPATSDDLHALLAIEHAAFESDRLSRRSLSHAICSSRTYSPVAEAAGHVFGYALLNFRKNSKKARISSLAAHKAPRGCGRTLMADCEREAHTRGCAIILLEVRSDNAAAIALYERLGYELFGQYEDYYEDGGCALRYQKSLTESHSS